MGIKKSDLESLIKEMSEIKYLQDKLSDDADASEMGDMIEDEKNIQSEEALDLLEISRNLNVSINNLPNKERKIFVYRYLKGLSHKEIAKKVGISEDKVRDIKVKIKEKLRKSPELSKYGDFFEK